MVFINPWASYKTEDIPDLNPHNDKEFRGCIAGVCGFVISTIIYVLINFQLFHLREIECIDMYCLPIMVAINSVVVYPILTIWIMKLLFKIADKFTTNKKKK